MTHEQLIKRAQSYGLTTRIDPTGLTSISMIYDRCHGLMLKCGSMFSVSRARNSAVLVPGASSRSLYPMISYRCLETSMPRRAAKKDANHQAIVRELRAIGCEVFDVASLPAFLDLIVAFRGRLTWLEIKQPHTRDDLTPLEQATIARLQRVGVPVFVVCTIDEAYKAIGAI